MLEWIRFGLVALFFAAGLIVLFISIFGTYRFKFSLNRMHSAAMCDTLVLMLFITGLIIASGILTLALQNCCQRLWTQSKSVLSLSLSAGGVCLFIISQQPYAAVFVFAFLIIKTLMLIKWQ